MKQLTGIIILILVILGVWAIVAAVGDNQETEYREVAETWVREESPTFTERGGDNLVFEQSEEVDENMYRYEFTFEASEAGYGEPAADEMAAQVVTEHSIEVTVEDGQVTQAVTDGVYDEMAGEEVSGDEPVEGETQEVSLYFYDEEEDTDAEGNVMCSADAVLPVERTIENYTIEQHIEALLEGPTEEEVEQGFSSEYPLEGFALESSNLDDGVLTLTFSDPQNATTGGSCRVGILNAQVRKTAESIEGVEEVVIEPGTLFQP